MRHTRSTETIPMRRRSGFTLVEVLVAMALILFIMTILAAAFGAATQAVSDFKAAGDLAERERAAATVLKRDLQADHFTDGFQNSPRMNDPVALWGRLINNQATPPVGFFRLFEGARAIPEGLDLDNLPCYRQTTNTLHYTIALHGSRRHDFLSAWLGAVPTSPLLSTVDPVLLSPDQRYEDTPNTTTPLAYSGQLAEVVVFLVPNGDTTDGSVPLFTLCRRQFLSVPTGWTPPPANIPQTFDEANYLEVSTVPASPEPGAGALTINDMKALAMPIRRFAMARNDPAGTLGAYLPTANQYATMGQSNAGFQSGDVLLNDVVSFDVRILIPGASDFVELLDPNGTVLPFFSGNPAFNAVTGPLAFDTWSNQSDSLSGANYVNWAVPGARTSAPLFQTAGPNARQIAIQAIQITLRVWDFKTKKTRQVTIVQQM